MMQMEASLRFDFRVGRCGIIRYFPGLIQALFKEYINCLTTRHFVKVRVGFTFYKDCSRMSEGLMKLFYVFCLITSYKYCECECEFLSFRSSDFDEILC